MNFRDDVGWRWFHSAIVMLWLVVIPAACVDAYCQQVVHFENQPNPGTEQWREDLEMRLVTAYNLKTSELTFEAEKIQGLWTAYEAAQRAFAVIYNKHSTQVDINERDPHQLSELAHSVNNASENITEVLTVLIGKMERQRKLLLDLVSEAQSKEDELFDSIPDVFPDEEDGGPTIQ
jgi:hypothetical protein